MRLSFLSLLILSLLLGACTASKTLDDSKELTVQTLRVPVLVEKSENKLLEFNIQSDSVAALNAVKISFAGATPLGQLKELTLLYHDGEQKQAFGKAVVNNQAIIINGTQALKNGDNKFSLSLSVNSDISISEKIFIKNIECHFDNEKMVSQSFTDDNATWRLGNVTRAAGQDNCDTYRIPGLVTTSAGTLIAVYDNRYNNSKDLQEDIDIGMSRSTDGGQTWQPMQVIMDMGEWGGRSERLNGITDPSVLYDHTTNTLWVAALWLSGYDHNQMAWWASQPGMKPDVTGQFMIAKSTDDGLTWSDPINITEQIKDPAWQLLLQGPGRGITLEDGTLVFPAQFKADIGEKALDGGQYTCHSTIVYSKDQGQTWTIGTGAKSNTTEAQVATLSDGTLMLNMRDDRNRKDKSETNGRAVATTKDLGKTWQIHPSSNSALPEPNCMAGFISAPVKIDGKTQHVLFFSNPNNKKHRTNMTIKASLDDGMTWPYELELNQTGGFGYSCLTMVDDNTVGILYEGVKELFFQKVPVTDIINDIK
ncbi:sialidase-1 [Saccharicrinis carchari]|uniref:exo-alpha-sialidase n=1 Tax=Saccharicrinis carchari TaxID=1168039 RepID=A0A521ENN6_SACCC|nr:sialidase family protein [Saccharicrinis carchari]SMO85514.1 sialidase-1 [Saccharicrinis carchari]